MLRNTFPVSVLTSFPESQLEFVRLDIEFWGQVLLIDIIWTVRKEVREWLAKVGRELGDRGGDW